MNFQDTIHSWTRFFVHEIVKDIGNFRATIQTTATVRPQVKCILVCRPNHRLGNLLLLTPLLQVLAETFPHCKIDLFVKGDLARTLFKNYENIDQIIQLPKRPCQHFIKYFHGWMQIQKKKYDMVINVDQSSRSGRLAIQLVNARHKIQGTFVDHLNMKFNDYEHHAKFPIYNFRNHLKKIGVVEKEKAIPALNLKLDLFEIYTGMKLLKRLVPNENRTVCLFTYATGNKCYSRSWWEDLYSRLKIEHPNFNFIEILPIQNVSQLSFKVPSFYSKDIRQIGSVIANTDMFVGADSGIMHLASAVEVPTVALFSVTDQTRYVPYNVNSIAIDTKYNNSEKCVQMISAILDNKV